MERTISLVTPHFQADLHLKDYYNDDYAGVSFYIGHKDSGQLSGMISIKGDYSGTINLQHMLSLQQSIFDDIQCGYDDTPRFGTEILKALIEFVRINYPMIHTMELTDLSYMDTIDLVIYSIMLYKQTWYEKRMKAYRIPKEEYNEYREQVELYASKKTKESVSWMEMQYNMIMSSYYTNSILHTYMKFFEETFHNTATFPDFFYRIGTVIPLNEQSAFYRRWVDEIVRIYITDDRSWSKRTWYIDIN
uniref:Uncharacterized protein n=1 Tax=viral metagenome TaxID=1070528 RepID=A0A6C0IIX9_9ZZZZ